MADKKILFIEGIIEKTKDNCISWDYLDKNKDLYTGMNWVNKEPELFALWIPKQSHYLDFDSDNSFYAQIKKVYIVLKVMHNGLADLYVVPHTFKNVVRLSAEKYGEYIIRLLNLVQSQFPDANDFIDEFINE